jgi:hypothetical protein
MPLQVDDITELQNYLAGVLQRANHHGQNVRHVVLALVGAIVRFKNPNHSIKVYAREGATGNVLWVYIGDSQYAFSYEHQSDSIVLKRGTTQGDVIANFTNATTIPQIEQVFQGL